MGSKFWQSGEYTANSSNSTDTAYVNILESDIEAQAPKNGRVTGMEVKLYIKHHGTSGSKGQYTMYLSGDSGNTLSTQNNAVPTSYLEVNNITVPCDSNGCINGNIVLKCYIFALAVIKWTAKIEVTWTYTDAYTVTWKNYDGTVLETDSNVVSGTTPTYNGSTPTRPAENGVVYSFSGWTPSVGAITGDTTYTATFTGVKMEYNLTAEAQPNDSAGYVSIESGSAPYYYGDKVTLKANPNSGYGFAHWGDGVKTNPRTYTVTSNIHAVAVFVKPPEISAVTIRRSSDSATVTIDKPVNAGAKYIISVTVT